MRRIDLSPDSARQRENRIGGGEPVRKIHDPVRIGRVSRGQRLRQFMRERVELSQLTDAELQQKARGNRLPMWTILLWVYFACWAASWLRN